MSNQMISIRPNQDGSFFIKIVPKDEKGNILTIGDLKNPKWQLMRIDGTVVNGRDFVSSDIAALEWFISGDDLEIFDTNDTGTRILVVKAEYDSTIGDDVPLIDSAQFTINKILQAKI